MDFNFLDAGSLHWKKSMWHHAKKYVREYGWKVFPIHPPIFSKDCKTVVCACGDKNCTDIGKHPIISWPDNCSSDIDVLYDWFKKFPSMNLGIATGKKSNIIVLDVDKVKGKRILLSQPKLPYTITARSSKGYHYYFKYPENKEKIKTTTEVLPGLDSRADGGYIVAAPSLHRDGFRYEWTDEPLIQEAPDWWLNLVEAPKQLSVEDLELDVSINAEGLNAYSSKALAEELAKIYSLKGLEGGRNNQLNSSSFSLYQLVAVGVLEEDLVFNALYDAGRAIGLTDRECLTTINSGKQGGLRAPRDIIINSNEKTL